MLLDGKRLSIRTGRAVAETRRPTAQDGPARWDAASGPQAAQAPATAAAAEFLQSQSAADARSLQDDRGHAHGRRDVPGNQPRPGLDLDKHFMRSTVQTGPTPGYTFFPHVGTIRIEGPFDATQAKDSPSRRKIFVCTPKTTAEETACARRIVTNLATNGFRRPATAADVNMLMEFYGSAGKRRTSIRASRWRSRARAVVTAVHLPHRGAAGGQPAGSGYRISDVDLASRLSFFLWSSAPDEELLKVAAAGRLNEPVMLERQVRRMLRHPKAERACRQLRRPVVEPARARRDDAAADALSNFDDPLREAMRKEVELLFDTIVREDRSVVDILNADYTFVNERLAKHYGIKNITGSQFRRVTLGPDMEARRGLLGKARSSRRVPSPTARLR